MPPAIDRSPDHAPRPIDTLRRDRGAVIGDDPKRRRSLVELFADAFSVRCGFTQLTVPASIDGVTGDTSAVYGLLDVAPDDGVLPGEVGIFGAAGVLGSCDAAPSGTQAPWGDVRGLGAAIVIGQDLGFQLGAWSASDVPAVGVEVSTAKASLVNNRGRVWWTLPFPAGDYEADFQKDPFGVAVTPNIFRVPSGRRIQVGLVVRGSQLGALGSVKALRGLAQVDVYGVSARTLDRTLDG